MLVEGDKKPTPNIVLFEVGLCKQLKSHRNINFH